MKESGVLSKLGSKGHKMKKGYHIPPLQAVRNRAYSHRVTRDHESSQRSQIPLLHYISSGALRLPNTSLGCVEHKRVEGSLQLGLWKMPVLFSLHGKRGFKDF